MSRILARVGTVAVFFVLAACSGEVAVPIASATADRMLVNTGNVVRLDGSSSKDPQGRQLFFEWSFVQVPVGSAATLQGADQMLPSFTADMPGDYTVQLIVSNGVVRSTPVTITIRVTQCGFTPPNVTVGTTSASTLSFTVNPGDSVPLHAVGTDPDNACLIGTQQTVTLTWRVGSRPPGSSAVIPSPTAADTTFSPDVVGQYQIEVIATDSTGRSSTPGFVNITANACALNVNGPSVSATQHFDGTVSTAPPTPQIFRGDLVTLAADAASCVASDTFTFAWEFTQKPAGSTATLLGADTATPSFRADVAGGTYAVVVHVTDAFGKSTTPAALQLGVQPVPGAPAVTGLAAFVTAATSATVTVQGDTNAACTSGAAGQAQITFVAAAAAPAISALGTVTVGTTFVASISPRAGMSYAWSTSAGSLGTVTGCTKVAATCSAQFTAPTSATTFVVSVTESNSVGD